METLFKVVRWGALAASLVLLVPGVGRAYTARLAWSPSSGAAGYRVYVRQNGDAYGAPIDVGMRAADVDGLVRYDLGGLDAAQDEWFAVTSYVASAESPRSNELGIPAGSVPVATATAVPTATRTATPVPTATQTAIPTATRTATPVPTATQTAVPTATRTPVPTATRTVTPVPTATETAIATAAPTPVPTVVAEVFHFPLAGWRTRRNKGTWEIGFDAETGRDVLVTSSEQGEKLSVLYPTQGLLSVALPTATFLAKLGPTGAIGLAVRGTDGRSYWLRYRVGTGVASVWRQSAWFPLGASVEEGEWGATTRDLAADFRAAFGVDFAAVEQAELSGTVALADLMLGPSTAPASGVAPEMALPLDATTVRSRGASVLWQYDAGMGCPTMGTPPDSETRAVVDVPASPRRLAAPYGRLSFVLAEARDFAVEVRVVTTAGTRTLRYDDATVSPVVRDRRARLPLTREPIDGSGLDLVTIDVAADVAAAYPGIRLLNVERVRVSGRFTIGDAMLENPLADD